MILKVPKLNSKSFDRNEARYLTHCSSIAKIIAHSDKIQFAKAKIDEYIRITGAEQKGENNG